MMRRLRGAARADVGPASATLSAAHGPLVAARLSDGPMAGMTVELVAVEGRPPKTVDVDGPDGTLSRYCLADWEQSGHAADYTFLYEV